MKINGTFCGEFDVDSFAVITELCQILGVVDEEGDLVATLKDKKIVKYSYDKWGKRHTKVLYDQPYDVQYASSLMRVYELSNNYLKLLPYMKDRNNGTNDYQTATKLKIRDLE